MADFEGEIGVWSSDLKDRFDLLMNYFQTDGDLRRPLPKIKMKIRSENEFNAKVRLWPKPEIIIHDGLLKTLVNFIDANQTNMCQAISYDSPASGPVNIPASSDLGRLVYDLASQFVVCHEIQHVLCGHIGLKASESGQGKSYVYCEIASQDMDPALDTQEALASYFREFQADNGALEMMILIFEFEALNKLLAQAFKPLAVNYDDQPIYDLSGQPKILAYRVILIAAWVAINLIESAKMKAEAKSTASHPLPKARLVTAVMTLINIYTGFDELFELDGKQTGRLNTDQQVAAINEFFHEVLGPVAKSLLSVKNNGVLKADTLALIGDMLLDRHQDDNIIKQQLNRVESLREEMTELLERHRYI